MPSGLGCLHVWAFLFFLINLCRMSHKPVRQNPTFFADKLSVEFLRGKRHFGNRELSFRIDIPRVMDSVKVNTIAVFEEILIFNVTGIERGDILYHLVAPPVAVGHFHSKAVHIVD